MISICCVGFACDLKATINKKPPRKVYQWSKADWQLIKEQTVIFAKQFLALALTRTVKENYTVFIEYMDGILAINIPSKLSNSRHNLPWMNRNLKRLISRKGRRVKQTKKSGMDHILLIFQILYLHLQMNTTINIYIYIYILKCVIHLIEIWSK